MSADMDIDNGKAPESLAAYLQQLRWRAGASTLRELGKAVGLSHTAVADALNGRDSAGWGSVSTLVTHLGGDLEIAHPLWLVQRPRRRNLGPLTEFQGDMIVDLLIEIRNLLKGDRQ